MSLSENTKMALDGASLATAVAALAAWLPPIAAFLSIVWTLLRIWETATVQGWVKHWLQRWRSNDYEDD